MKYHYLYRRFTHWMKGERQAHGGLAHVLVSPYSGLQPTSVSGDKFCGGLPGLLGDPLPRGVTLTLL